MVGKSVAKSLWGAIGLGNGLGSGVVESAVDSVVDPLDPMHGTFEYYETSHVAAQRMLAQRHAQQQLEALQNQNAQSWHGLSGGIVSQSFTSPAPTISVNPLLQRGQEKLALMGQMLPMRVLQKIQSAQLFHEPLKFVVVFNNQQRLEFEDVDAFPSEEHIARIALECP